MEHAVFGAVQLSSQAGVGANLDRAAAWIGEAARRGASVVLLPENFAYLGDDAGRRAIAEEIEPGEPRGPIGKRLGEGARAPRVHALAGGMRERAADPARPYNCFAVLGPDGQVAAKYRKIHLFDV